MTLAQIKAELAALKASFTTKPAATAEALSAFQAKLTEIESAVENDLTQAVADLTTAKQTISTLTASLEKAQNEANAANTQITNLKSEVETEKKRANDTLAKMGIDPEKVPATPAAPSKASDGAKIMEQLNAISDPNQRTLFYRKNAAAIKAARLAQGRGE
jgi:chromosome segregation ATPase